MTEESNDELQEDLRKSLQLAVCKIVFDEDRKQGTRTTQSAIAALTELTYQYATKSLVPDLYAFSTHANRKSTISPDDVALVLRKIQPDQLEAFKNKFCRGGGGKGSASSKNAVDNENDGKRATTTAGRRRKRGETEVLSLSSSSSSSSDDDDGDEKMVNGKQKRNSGRISVSPRRINTKITGRKSTERESLLNKFQLRSGPSAAIGKKSTLGYDTLSSDDDDSIMISPPKGLGIAKTASSAVSEKGTTAQKSRISPKLSLKRSPRKKEQKSRNKNDNFLYDDDDSSDDDDSFLGINANRKAEKVVDLQRRQVANPSDRENESKENFDDDKFVNNRLGSKASGGIQRASQKQSQVAQALANLSSDSGMEVDDSEDEHTMHLNAKPAFSHRHRPRIESDDDE